jgi:hypothetical protein
MARSLTITSGKRFSVRWRSARLPERVTSAWFKHATHQRFRQATKGQDALGE